MTAGLRLLSVAQAAETLGISRSMVRKLLRSQELQTIRIGRRTLLHPHDLARYVEERRSGRAGGHVIAMSAAGGAGR